MDDRGAFALLPEEAWKTLLESIPREDLPQLKDVNKHPRANCISKVFKTIKMSSRYADGFPPPLDDFIQGFAGEHQFSLVEDVLEDTQELHLHDPSIFGTIAHIDTPLLESFTFTQNTPGMIDLNIFKKFYLDNCRTLCFLSLQD
ncbi:hypothetical protein BBP40_012018 [Aspergillus hancockii]|nr:hypothetical protein BBP40_012018 [Aspergillus hancockii]